MNIPTVSSLQRAVACEASVVLEQLPPEPSGAAAKRGSLLGAWAAASLRGWDMPDLGRYKINWSIDELRKRLPAGDIKCEAAFSYSGEAAEYLGENLGRSYGRPGTICGAADILVVREGQGFVFDLKSGKRPVPDAKSNWQLAALAMMASLAFGFDDVTAAIVKFGANGEWDFGEPYTWDAGELDVIRKRLDAEWRRWKEASSLADAGFDVDRVTGEHCYWCAARCEYGGVYQRAQKQAA